MYIILQKEHKKALQTWTPNKNILHKFVILQTEGILSLLLMGHETLTLCTKYILAWFATNQDS